MRRWLPEKRDAHHVGEGLLAGRRGLGEHRPEQGWAGDAADTGRAIAEVHPVQQDQPDDLAEAHGDDGEIVAAQAQHGKAQQQPEARRHHAGKRQDRPEAQPILGAEQRVGIGADGVERDIAEIEQAREADHDVQPPAEHDVGQDQDGKVHRLLVRKRRHRHDDGGHQQGGAEPFGDGLADRHAAWRVTCNSEPMVRPRPDRAQHDKQARQRDEPVQESRRQLERRRADRTQYRAEGEGRPGEAVSRQRQAEPAEEDRDDGNSEIGRTGSRRSGPCRCRRCGSRR